MAYVNGTSYDDVSIMIAGMKIGGIDAINYTDSEEDPEPIYDQGSREVVGMGLGSDQLVDVTIEFQKRGWDEFSAPAKAAGKSVREYWPFTVTVAYANKVAAGLFIASVLNVINIDTISNCKVVNVDQPHRRGDKITTVTVTLRGTEVR
jgi:hypothetical protein